MDVLGLYNLRGREDFFGKNLFGSPSDPESKNIVFIDTVGCLKIDEGCLILMAVGENSG